MTLFIYTQKQRQFLKKVILMRYLNQSILQLYQTYKNFRKRLIEHNVSILRYNPLAGNSYIKLTKELDHPRK